MLSHLLLLSPPILSAIPFCPLFSFHFILFLPPFFVPLLSLRFFLFSHFLRYSLIPPFLSSNFVSFSVYFQSLHILPFTSFLPLLSFDSISFQTNSFSPLPSYNFLSPSVLLLMPLALYVLCCSPPFFFLYFAFITFSPFPWVSFPFLLSSPIPFFPLIFARHPHHSPLIESELL